MKTPCPDLESLERHVSGDVRADEAEHIRTHVDACAECKSTFDEICANLNIAAHVGVVLRHRETENLEPLPGTVGAYRILSEIGRGGMGVVYLAEQAHPKRQVALKVIRPGASSATLMRRFEREADVLARLQHPGIAQIFEAGVAETQVGERVERRPFLVMEYVRGEPLLQFADRRALGTRERLALLADIADAVHHAHEHGVIHRDLKPGNVLVADGSAASADSNRTAASAPRPKVLDFGVARITEADIQTVTMQTEVGQLVGTIPYMSPEQVTGDPEKLDARSDVYALGVIAYELLTGRLPHELRNCVIPEAVRIIRDDDPTPIGIMNRSFRGDVDTIISKALEKEPGRRYSTAADLAADIRRFLRDEPIVARPAGTLYQFGKFARRNKPLVAGVTVAFTALLVGFAIALWEAQAAVRARDAAMAQTEVAKAVNTFLEDMLAAVDPRNLPNRRDITVREALDQAAAEIDAGELKDQPKTEAGVRATIGNTYRALGMLPEAEHQLAESVRIGRAAYGGDDESLAFSLHKLALVHAELGRYEESESLVREALEMRRRLLGEDHPDTLKSMNNLAHVLFDRGDHVASEKLHRETLARRRRVLGQRHTDVANSMNNLATVLAAPGNNEEEVEALYRESLEIDLDFHGEDHPHVAITMGNLADCLQAQGKFDDAEPLLTRALELQRRSLGTEHPSVAFTLSKLAALMSARGNQDEAERLLRETAELQQRTRGERHPDVAMTLTAISEILQSRGELDEAEQLLIEALAIRRDALGDDHRDTLLASLRVAMLDRNRSNFEAAEARLAEVVATARRALPKDDMYMMLFFREHGQSLADIGKLDDAEASLLQAFEMVSERYASDSQAARYTASFLVRLYERMGQPEKAASWRSRVTASAPANP